MSEFRPGDEVFGGRTGACAEYVVAKSDRAIVKKPSNVTFESAAAVPVAATTALQATPRPGQARGGAAGARSRRVRRRRHLRDPDREGARRPGDRGLRPAGRRDRALARGRRGHRLLEGGRDTQRSPLRSRDRHRRDAVLPAAAARAHSGGDGRGRRGQEDEPTARPARPPGGMPDRRDVREPEGHVLPREARESGHGDAGRAPRGGEADLGRRRRLPVRPARRRARAHGRPGTRAERSSSRCRTLDGRPAGRAP